MRRFLFRRLPLVLLSLLLVLMTACDADVRVLSVSEEGVKVDAHTNRAFTVSGGGTKSFLSFEYKLLGEGLIDVALINDDWGSNYFGYYYFNEKGALGNYYGVNTEKTEDGFIKVFFDVNELKVLFGDRKPEVVKVVFIRLTNSDSDVLIRNGQ